MWGDLGLDMLGNFFVGCAAYALLKGRNFNWNDTRLIESYAGMAVIMVLIVLFGVLVESEDRLWKMFYISPSLLTSTGVLIALSISIFREPVAHFVRIPIVLILLTYSILQLPVYIFQYVDTSEAASKSADVLRIFLVVGKFALFFALTALVFSLFGERKAVSVLTGTRITIWVLSICFSVFVLLFRVFQSIWVMG